MFYSTLPPWRNHRSPFKRSFPKSIAQSSLTISATRRPGSWLCLLSARRQGVPVSFVEVANEPDGTWNTRYTPEQYVTLVNAVKQRWGENQLAEVKIEGPGTSTLSSAGPYIAELVRSGALNKISMRYPRMTGTLAAIRQHLAQTPSSMRSGIAGSKPYRHMSRVQRR